MTSLELTGVNIGLALELTQLTTLKIINANRLKNISSNTNLKTLELVSHTLIRDFSALSKLFDLQSLVLINNVLMSDAYFVRGLTNLNFLDLSHSRGLTEPPLNGLI
jgi:Leucine-rich repeat (LRR) protein